MRLSEAKQRFRNINTDMGRIFLLHGPPDGVRKIDCQDIYWPIQIWYYERIEELRMSKVLLLFYQQLGVGDYRLWTPLDGQAALIVGNMRGRPGWRRGAPRRRDALRGVPRRPRRREHGRGELRGDRRHENGRRPQDGRQARRRGRGPHPPDDDGHPQTGAAALPIQRVFRFPELVGSRMRMELAVLLERESLTKKQIGEESFYDIDLVGEVVRDGRLVDNFRYRFDFPASSVSGPFVPLTIERELYPGEYQLRVKVQDSNRNAAALIKERLKVPDTPEAAMTAEEKAAREAAKKGRHRARRDRRRAPRESSRSSRSRARSRRD